MEIEAIAYARNGFVDKFGIPRQSQNDSLIETHISFAHNYRDANMLRGIEQFSHLWLIWGFSEAATWSATVRPPRLGGNTRVGVLATRSPFRPNHLGLTSVRLLRVEKGELVVSGADLLDGTPIYDIKPYLSFSDSHPDALNGFAQEPSHYRLSVEWSEAAAAEAGVQKDDYAAIVEILSQDPRPGYHHDERVYGLDYQRWNIQFQVRSSVLYVLSCKLT